MAHDPNDTPVLLEAVITAFAVLGGFMAYLSGLYAAQALTEYQSPELVAQRVDEDIGEGFVKGALPAIAALMIAVWN